MGYGLKLGDIRGYLLWSLLVTIGRMRLGLARQDFDSAPTR
jgi:hypothetical protein